jgi:N-acetylmuramoyl-L-alanine amidase
MLIAERPSPNQNERRSPLDMLVIHYTGMEPAERAIQWLCDPVSQVSAHYLINQDGAVTRMVAEERRAWHAGVSWWRGQDDINSRSIGIELANPGHDYGYCDFPEAQIAALIELAQGIVDRHAIPARNVVGHSDIAPRRKIDPGELFPWRRLAEAGLGLWPRDAEDAGLPADGEPLADPDALAATLAEIGYPVAEAGLDACCDAFQRHYRPAAIHGLADAGTARLAAALLVHLQAGFAGGLAGGVALP